MFKSKIWREGELVAVIGSSRRHLKTIHKGRYKRFKARNLPKPKVSASSSSMHLSMLQFGQHSYKF
ncbi:hypothetical protein Syun_028272 [Stephania yunnanensis]|uniref:Uncharacterized protein n=1 Tax=Stephania yunnanensis TaxID=152371 RepID=A0AAP0HQZ2_9MAGN